MTEGIFSQYASKLLEDTISSYSVIEPADAIDFVTSSEFLNEDPTPFQRVALKTLYSLWPKRPPDNEEEELIDTLKRNWDIIIDLDRFDPVVRFVLALGRRSTKCVPYDAFITDADKGTRYKIGYLYEHPEVHPPIYTLSTDTYRLKTTLNYSVMYSGVKQLYELNTKTGYKGEFTSNHPFLTLRGWKSLEDLGIGDRIAVPKRYYTFKEKQLDNLTLEEAKILGYLTGDGATAGNFNFTNYDNTIIKDFKKTVTILKCKLREFRKNHFLIVGKHYRKNSILELTRKHGLLGVKAIHKKVPDVIFESSERITSEFLKALFACDSNVAVYSEGGWFNYASSSEELIYGVRHLLLKYGIQSIIKKRRASYFSKKYKERRYFTSFSLLIQQKEHLQTLQDRIGITGRKQKRLRKLCSMKSKCIIDNALIDTLPIEIWDYIEDLRQKNALTLQQMRDIGGGYTFQWAPTKTKVKRFADYFNDPLLQNLVKGDVIWDFVKTKAKTRKASTYDLNVPDTENFIANDIIVHNSTLASFLASYALYTLICRGDPQRHYGIRERHPIFVTHVAAAGHQAEAVFTLTKDNLRKTNFFSEYIDFDKNSTTELRLYTPYDVYLNKQIKAKNNLVNRGEVKEPLLAGSLYAKSITTSAATHRGDATFMLMLSEFAHFQRAHMDPSKSSDQLAEENPQTDYAIDKALVPATKDFGSDAKVIYESSPAEKGGQYYHYYCVAGGMEQEPDLRQEREVGYALIQLATWEARPTITRDSLDPEFRTDPVGAGSEYGAHFRNPSGAFIPESMIHAIPQPGFPMILQNPSNWRFVIVVDAGGKGKSKKADTYALGWGHVDMKEDERLSNYWIDGLVGWDAQIKDLGMGAIEHIPVDPNMVVRYIIELMENLGGKNYILQVCYDQWQNQMAVSMLQNAGIPAIETTFTNQYKALMYGNFFSKAERGQVKMFGDDASGWVERWKTEMKYLQRITAGKTTYYRHPDSGPVQHDDFADVCLLPGSKVITKNYIIRDIESIKEGEKVLTHRGRFRRVLKTSKRYYQGNINKITTKGGWQPLKCTSTHKIYSHISKECNYVSKRKGMCSPFCDLQRKMNCPESWRKPKVWEEAENIQKTDLLYLPLCSFKAGKDYIDLLEYLSEDIINNIYEKDNLLYYGHCGSSKKNNKLRVNSKARGVPRYIKVDNAFARLIGYFLAEGSTSKDRATVAFSFNLDEEEYYEDVVQIVKDKFNIDMSYSKNKEAKSCQVYFYRTLLKHFFRYNFGTGAKSRVIPEWVFRLSSEQIAHLLEGYFRGDGFLSTGGQYSAGSACENFIHQLRFLSAYAGIFTTYNFIPPEAFIEKGYGTSLGQGQHQIHIAGEYLDVLKDLLNEERVGKDREVHKLHWIDKEAIHPRVRENIQEYFEGDVYNLEVEEDNSYVTLSGAVHNCANIIYRLSVWHYPTKETMKQNVLKKQGMPIQRKTTISPVRGPNLSGGGSGLADRLRRR